MQKSMKDRLIYGVIFLIFVGLSFVFFGNSESEQLKGSLMIENEDNLAFDEKQDELRRMLAENGFSNLECARGVWPTVKCEFDLVTPKVAEVSEIKNIVSEVVNNIGFENSEINKSLSCFDLNNLDIHQSDENFVAKVRATCILNLRKVDN